MSIFTEITPEQLEKRYEILPDNMVGVLQSPSTKSSADAIATEYGMQGNEVLLFEMLVSYVLMGFLHPDNVSEELTGFFELPAEKAKEISLKLNAEVFALYRADIEKVYLPPATYLPKPAPLPSNASGPTLNLKPTAPTTAPAPLPSALPTTSPTPSFSSLDLSSSRVPVTAGAPSNTPKPPTPTAPSTPFVLHKETSNEPVVANSGFRLNLGIPAFGASSGTPPAPNAPRPAKLELGKEVKREVPKPLSTQIDQKRVVHYSDLRSNISNVPPAPSVKPAPLNTFAPVPVANPAPAPFTFQANQGAVPAVKTSGDKSSIPQPTTVTPSPIPTPQAPPKVVNFTAKGGNEVK